MYKLIVKKNICTLCTKHSLCKKYQNSWKKGGPESIKTISYEKKEVALPLPVCGWGCAWFCSGGLLHLQLSITKRCVPAGFFLMKLFFFLMKLFFFLMKLFLSYFRTRLLYFHRSHPPLKFHYYILFQLIVSFIYLLPVLLRIIATLLVKIFSLAVTDINLLSFFIPYSCFFVFSAASSASN